MRKKNILIMGVSLLVTLFCFLGVIYPFRVSKLSTELYYAKEENVALKERVEELEEENNKLNFEKSLERTCGLQSVECGNEWRFKALVSATFRIETGNGTSRLWLDYNNAGGIKCGGGYCSYQTQEQGYNALKTLLERYVEKYGYDLKSIREEYCGDHCGSEDLIEFTKIYKEEIRRISYGVCDL